MKRKTVTVRLYLWTDELQRGECWAAGSAYVPVKDNEQHGAVSGPNVIFNTLDELPAAVAKALQQSGLRAIPMTKQSAKVPE